MHPVARRLEDRAHEGDQRPFAVGARDMDHRRQPVLRPAELVQQIHGPAEGQVDLLGVQRHQPRQYGVAAARVLRVRGQGQPICGDASSADSASSDCGICKVSSAPG